MRFKSGELVIEMAGDRCQNYYLPILSLALRGRFDVRKIGRESVRTSMNSLPVIPGHYVALDQKGRLLRVLDPLGFVENKNVLDEANRIIETWFGRMRPHDTSVLRDLEPWEAKTSLWWMAQAVWDGSAVIVNGDLPGNDAAGRKKLLLETPGDLKMRWYTLLTLPDGSQESAFASEAEIARLVGGPQGARMAMEPAGVA